MLSTTDAVTGGLTTQTMDGRNLASGLSWHHPSGHLEWRNAGYEDAMHSIVDLALALAGRPDSTALDTLQGVIELALGVIEMRRPGLAEALARQAQAP